MVSFLNIFIRHTVYHYILIPSFVHSVTLEHLLVVLVVPQRSNTAAQCQEGGVDVVGLFHPLTITLLFRAFRSSQITHSQSDKDKTQHCYNSTHEFKLKCGIGSSMFPYSLMCMAWPESACGGMCRTRMEKMLWLSK